ncbi:MAG: hypothetical protein WCE79_09485 [Xanthobacteraceae bacterium]
MADAVFRTLVPDAPLYRRTEGDVARSDLFALRERLTNFSLTVEPKRPGLKQPSLVSTYDGKIKSLLLSLPKFSVTDGDLAPAYQSLIRALEVGTKFVVVHHKSHRGEIDKWFADAGHSANVTYVSLADYVSFTDWAEDSYVSLVDKEDGAHYLMEPWEFKRSGDALIADAVEEAGVLSASQAPLIFQGGNCLVGKDHWFLGRDYFADSVALLTGQRPPVTIPKDTLAAKFTLDLFKDYVDAERELILLGTEKPISLRQYVGAKEGSEYILDIPAEGAGTYQPIFHIDMFVTLAGKRKNEKFKVLVGDPALADEALGTKSSYALAGVYGIIAKQIADLGFEVLRNPLVHWPTKGRKYKLSNLKEIATSSQSEALSRAVAELTSLGANDATDVTARSWHHITWNNCLVEDMDQGSTVYLPTFGYGDKSKLAALDQHMASLWKGLGFQVKLLGDFNGFARRQGVVHCIKKYLERAPS